MKILYIIANAILLTACTKRTQHKANFLCHYTNLAVLLRAAVSYDSPLPDSLDKLNQALHSKGGAPIPHYLLSDVRTAITSRSDVAHIEVLTSAQSGMWYIVDCDYDRAAQCYFDAYRADPRDLRNLDYAVAACMKSSVSNITTHRIVYTFFTLSTDAYMVALHRCLFSQYNKDFIAAKSNAMHGIALFPRRDGVFKGNLLLTELCQKKEVLNVRSIRSLCWELYERGYRDEWFANIMERFGDRRMKQAAQQMRKKLSVRRPFEIVH